MTLKVTKNASNKIAELIKHKEATNSALRVGVEGGGCSGLIYKYELIPDSDITENDHIIMQDEAKVVVDMISYNLLKNCTIDFIEELTGSYFEIKNPSAARKCGCGKSFSM